MKIDKKIEYYENKIEDLKELLKMADKGYDVGDTDKLEMMIEDYENKIAKELEKVKPKEDPKPSNININEIDFDEILENVDKQVNTKKQYKFKEIFRFIIIIWITLSIGIYIGVTN